VLGFMTLSTAAGESPRHASHGSGLTDHVWSIRELLTAA
jgi:hypothetical protein